MSNEIIRLHREPTEFTNFSGSETPKPTEQSSVEQPRKRRRRRVDSTVEQSSQEPRKRRRRRVDSTAEISDDTSVSNPIEPPQQDIEKNSENIAPAEPLVIASHGSETTNDIDAVRADLREDLSHSTFADSNYSDDTHDWGGDSQDISDDYWHFVGSFE